MPCYFLWSVGMKINLKYHNQKNIFFKHGYYNDHFKLGNMGADSVLIGIVVTNWGSYYKFTQVYYETGQLLLTGEIIKNRCTTDVTAVFPVHSKYFEFY